MQGTHLLHQADTHALDVVDIEGRILEGEPSCSQKSMQGECRRTCRRQRRPVREDKEPAQGDVPASATGKRRE